MEKQTIREKVLARSREADRKFQESLKNSEGGGEMVKTTKPKKVAKKAVKKKKRNKKKAND